ncbi:tRNA preQ1(34) S-adenosylmethionine ribosyltransferase-isomerase QueA [Eubacteriales bacterium KG127]
MNINDFDYNLPKELIAQYPTQERDKCRLMVLNRDNKSISHKNFYEILDYLKPGDCMVFNSSKVLPARIFGEKVGTQVPVEFLLIKKMEEGHETWETMVRPGRRLKPGDRVRFGEKGDGSCGIEAEILSYGESGTRMVRFIYEGDFLERLGEIGNMPLPPYIGRESEEKDKETYQTVYADKLGSVASPTAGLHFTQNLMEKARKKGIKLEFVTLHVGIGTFRPVKVEIIEEHRMHFEKYSISDKTAESINESILSGNRIITVGTTSTRTLESAAYLDEVTGKYLVKSGAGSTGIFIYPGYKFKIVKALITNFHLPKSTLIMLISALYNREEILKAYDEAVKEKYRFFSYGDAMLIE